MTDKRTGRPHDETAGQMVIAATAASVPPSAAVGHALVGLCRVDRGRWCAACGADPDPDQPLAFAPLAECMVCVLHARCVCATPDPATAGRWRS